jgi:hypothetical protein
MFTLAKFLSFGIEIQTIMGTRILDFQFIWRLQRTKASHMKATVIQTSYNSYCLKIFLINQHDPI